MNVKTWIPLVLAVLLGLVALVIGRKVVAHRPAEQPANTVQVVVAARDVAPGRVITAQDVTAGRVPKEMAPARSFSDTKDVVGRTATFSLLKGQAVVETLLAAQGTGAGVQALIPAGMRAITVEVNEFSGLGGLLAPGSRVDVVATVREDKAQQQTSRTILQNIKVLAVGRQFNPNPPPPAENAPPLPAANNVTLLVTPKQAQALKLASQGGAPWLVLRNLSDASEVETDPTLLSDLKGDRPLFGFGGSDRSAQGGGFLGVNGWFRGPVAGNGTAANGGVGLPTWTGTGPTRPATPGRRATRPVHVIRGGVESEVNVVVPPAPKQLLTEWRPLPQAPAAPVQDPSTVSSTRD